MQIFLKSSKEVVAREDAGIMEFDDDHYYAVGLESHNHPSALEPYQGAATGVGGINRDIFTMGARPVAQLNSLRFGNIDLNKTKWLVKGVTKGIGDYGNAFGIPIVGGEVFFDDCYNTNPLVNAFSAGIMKKGNMISATSSGLRNFFSGCLSVIFSIILSFRNNFAASSVSVTVGAIALMFISSIISLVNLFPIGFITPISPALLIR